MPIYEYRCENCDFLLSVEQKMKNYKPKKKCPSCKKNKLERIISPSLFFIKGEPGTVGHWAERNTQKMGKYEIEDKTSKQISKKPADPWWKRGSKYSNKEIRKMSDSERRKFIESGE